MDKDHRLDAPDNESLRTIEQLSDHSELTTIYPHARDEWEGVELLSREEREARRDKEQLRINITLRRWFAVIGLLVPVPFIIGAFLVSLATTFIVIENLAYLLLPIVIAFTVWVYLSYRAIKRVYGIFYDHSVNATPFIIALLALLLMSVQGHYMALLPVYTDSLIFNSLITSATILVTSIIISGLLVLIWTSKKMSTAFKLASIGLIAIAILSASIYIYFVLR